MSGRKTSGSGSFRLGNGLIKRSTGRIPAGVFVPGSVDMPGAESSSRAILYIERNPETVKSISSFPSR
jgi:hypothetical protein